MDCKILLIALLVPIGFSLFGLAEAAEARAKAIAEHIEGLKANQDVRKAKLAGEISGKSRKNLRKKIRKTERKIEDKEDELWDEQNSDTYSSSSDNRGHYFYRRFDSGDSSSTYSSDYSEWAHRDSGPQSKYPAPKPLPSGRKGHRKLKAKNEHLPRPKLPQQFRSVPKPHQEQEPKDKSEDLRAVQYRSDENWKRLEKAWGVCDSAFSDEEEEAEYEGSEESSFESWELEGDSEEEGGMSLSESVRDYREREHRRRECKRWRKMRNAVIEYLDYVDQGRGQATESEGPVVIKPYFARHWMPVAEVSKKLAKDLRRTLKNFKNERGELELPEDLAMGPTLKSDLAKHWKHVPLPQAMKQIVLAHTRFFGGTAASNTKRKQSAGKNAVIVLLNQQIIARVRGLNKIRQELRHGSDSPQNSTEEQITGLETELVSVLLAFFKREIDEGNPSFVRFKPEKFESVKQLVKTIAEKQRAITELQMKRSLDGLERIFGQLAEALERITNRDDEFIEDADESGEEDGEQESVHSSADEHGPLYSDDDAASDKQPLLEKREGPLSVESASKDAE